MIESGQRRNTPCKLSRYTNERSNFSLPSFSGSMEAICPSLSRMATARMSSATSWRQSMELCHFAFQAARVAGRYAATAMRIDS
jgi:hypothetical protein